MTDKARAKGVNLRQRLKLIGPDLFKAIAHEHHSTTKGPLFRAALKFGGVGHARKLPGFSERRPGAARSQAYYVCPRSRLGLGNLRARNAVDRRLSTGGGGFTRKEPNALAPVQPSPAPDSRPLRARHGAPGPEKLV